MVGRQSLFWFLYIIDYNDISDNTKLNRILKQKTTQHRIDWSKRGTKHKLVREIKYTAQMLRTFFRIRCDPRRAHVCMQPITSGIPSDFKNPGSLLGTVPNALITIGIDSVCTLKVDRISVARVEYFSIFSSSLALTLPSHVKKYYYSVSWGSIINDYPLLLWLQC